jgi:ketosteroid isomerase-like protein
MSAAENKQLMQQIFAELAQGNARPLVEAMADDFRWHVAGTGTWAHTFEGKQAVIQELFGVLRERIEGNVKTIPQRFIADEDFVVVEARGNNVTKSGVPYNNTYCFVFRLADSKLQEVTEYMDTELCTAALGVLA